MRNTWTGPLLLVLAGCANPLSSSADDAVTATLEAEGLRVVNGRAETIYYAAIGENALILFAPCVRADCPRLGAGAEVLLPFDDIPAGAASPAIAVHWWQARTGAMGVREPGAVHTITVNR